MGYPGYNKVTYLITNTTEWLFQLFLTKEILSAPELYFPYLIHIGIYGHVSKFCHIILLTIIQTFYYTIHLFQVIFFYFRPLQPSGQAITFQTEYPPPPGSNIPLRPFGQGCSNLYCSQSLLQFLKATHVKLIFHNHTLAQNPQHKYYGLQRILVTGRLA